jgi:hypothetical protein
MNFGDYIFLLGCPVYWLGSVELSNRVHSGRYESTYGSMDMDSAAICEGNRGDLASPADGEAVGTAALGAPIHLLCNEPNSPE